MQGGQCTRFSHFDIASGATDFGFIGWRAGKVIPSGGGVSNLALLVSAAVFSIVSVDYPGAGMLEISGEINLHNYFLGSILPSTD